MVSTKLILGLIPIVIALIILAGLVYTLEKIDDPTKVGYSPTEGFTVETDFGLVPLPQDIRGTEESKIYPIGDTIIDNTLISNSHGFVISVPNDN